jgi:DNA-binding LacI/PurR family transcriptional regulator
MKVLSTKHFPVAIPGKRELASFNDGVVVPHPTVYDVANQAEVSISTVSRVLNAPESVGTATRARVLSAIDELGFVPKAEAAALARKAGTRIGVLAPFFTFPSFVERLRGVANALSASPSELVIYNVDSSARRDGYLASLPVTRRLDGLIVMALPFDGVAAKRLVANRLETVLIEFSEEPFSSIRIDDHAGGQMAGEYLLEQGHRRCAFVGDCDLPDYAIHTSDRRLAGYRQALDAAGVELPDAYIALAPHSRENARLSALQLLDLPEPPTAIFVASDHQAVGVLKAARERGLAVPRELAVLGFDDLDIAHYIGLTTVRQPLEESGRVAVELTLSRLADSSRPAQRVRLPLTLVRRETA